MIRIEIPTEPVAFARARSNGARRFTPPKQAAYRQTVGLYARRAMAGLPMIEGPISMRLRFFYTFPASWSAKKKAATIWSVSVPDLDNLVKECADSLSGIVYRDDAQIAQLVVSKQYGPEARVVIELESLEGE